MLSLAKNIQILSRNYMNVTLLWERKRNIDQEIKKSNRAEIW